MGEEFMSPASSSQIPKGLYIILKGRRHLKSRKTYVYIDSHTFININISRSADIIFTSRNVFG